MSIVSKILKDIRTADEGQKKSLQEQLEAILKTQTTFQTGDLPDDLTAEDIECLSQAFEKTWAFSENTLVLDKIYPDLLIDQLVNRIKKKNCFKTLQLEIAIDKNMSQRLGEILKGYHWLKNLYIKHPENAVSFSNVNPLVASLRYNYFIRTLSFENFIINSAEVQSLADMLQATNELISLDLQKCNVLEAETERVKKSLETIKTKIDRNKEKSHRDEIVKLLKNMRKDPKKQQKTALKKAIEQQTLSFERENLNDEDIINLAEALKTNQTVTQLLIKDIKIGTEGIKALSEMLSANKTIRHLTLCKVSMSSREFFSWCRHSLKNNKSLLKLDLSDNPFGEDIVRNLNYLLESKSAVQELTLRPSDNCTYYLDDLNKLDKLLKENKLFRFVGLPFDRKNLHWLWKGAIESIDSTLAQNEANIQKARKAARAEAFGEAVGLHLAPDVADIVGEFLGLPSENYEHFKAGVAEAPKKAATAAKLRAEEAAKSASIAEQQAMAAAEKAISLEKQLKVRAERARELAESDKHLKEVIKDLQTAKSMESQISVIFAAIDNPTTEQTLAAANSPEVTNTLPDPTAPTVDTPPLTPQVQQPEKPPEPRVEPSQDIAATLSEASQPPEKKLLQTVAGICLAIAIIAVPILFILTTPLAGSLVLAALLTISGMAFGLSKRVEKSEGGSAAQPARIEPSQQASTEGPKIQQGAQPGIELNLGSDLEKAGAKSQVDTIAPPAESIEKPQVEKLEEQVQENESIVDKLPQEARKIKLK